MPSSPGSDSTGTIKATFVVLSGNTDANGEITMSRVFTSDQPIAGKARKSSGTPYYQTSVISGTVDSVAGYSTTVAMVLDE